MFHALIAAASATLVDSDCALSDNELRITCQALIAPGSTATVSWREAGGSWAWEDQELAPYGQWTLVGLRENTVHQVQVRSGADVDTYVITTGEAPLGGESISVSGTPTGWSHGLTNVGEVLVIFDDDGTPVWYQDVESTIAFYEYTDGDTVVVLDVGNHQILEYALDAEDPIVTIPAAAGYRFHHDVSKANGRYHVTCEVNPGAASERECVQVYDASGTLLNTWWFDSVYAQEARGGNDWVHANSVEVTDAGNWILSAYSLGMVSAIDPSTGNELWSLSDHTSQATDAYALPDGVDVDRQHHPNLRSYGRLLLFDNGDVTDGRNSRALELWLDPWTGTISQASTFDMDDHCNTRGSAFPLDDDGVLATCADVGHAREFASDGSTLSDIHFSDAAAVGTFSRVQPVDPAF